MLLQDACSRSLHQHHRRFIFHSNRNLFSHSDTSHETDWVTQRCLLCDVFAATDYIYPHEAVFLRAGPEVEKTQDPVKEHFCNTSSIAEIQSIQLCLLNGIMDFFFWVHHSSASDCNQYPKCCLSAHEAHCFTHARLPQNAFLS